MVLNSKFFGVPQNRERVFIIANLRGKPRPEILPFRENATEVSELYYETQDSQPEIGQAKRRYGIKGISPPLQNWSPLIMTLERKEFREHKSEGTPTLKNRMGTGGNNVPMVMNPKLRDYTIKAITNVTKSRDSKVLDPEGISHTLTAGKDYKVFQMIGQKAYLILKDISNLETQLQLMLFKQYQKSLNRTIMK